ncbi:C2 domain [Dillenia turbinata]|uniref:C2 domain n=1 Tax=Dillenia turbinata TaxID=194707 RepID=A0AAN8W168_9MAGN
MTRVNYRIVQIKGIEAKNLEAVGTESKMKVYAKISINGIGRTVKRTRIDKQGQSGPKRNFLVKYSVGENAFSPCGAMLHIKLYYFVEKMTRVNYRIVQIKGIEAKNLEAVGTESKLKVYAKISINGIGRTVKRTRIAKQGQCRPKRNFRVKYSKDQYIGEVSMPMMDLFARSNQQLQEGGTEVNKDSQKPQGEIPVSFEVYRRSEKSQGEITFSCKISDVQTIKRRKKWLARALDITIQVVSVVSCYTTLPISVESCVNADYNSSP